MLTSDNIQDKIQPIELKLAIVGAFTTAIFIIAIYISTPLSIIVSILVGIIWLLSAQFKKLPTIFKQSAVNTWAVLLFLCLILGLSYGDVPDQQAYALLRKYRELLYIPILACFFTDERYRKWAWAAFIIGSILTLFSSYLMDFGLMKLNRYRTFTLKSRITHSIFISYFLFFCLHQYFETKKYKLIYLIILIVGIYNLYFVTGGRTGQLVFVLLVLLFALQRLSKRGLLISISLIVIFMTLYLHFSDKSNRVHKTIEIVHSYLDPSFQAKSVNTDLRFSYWQSSLELIKSKPWLGYGTGSFGQEHRRITQNKLDKLENPHNEYLLFIVQCGLFGLLVYLGFLYSQYHDSNKLPDSEKWLAQGLLLNLAVSSLFNSPFLDHAEGHWFSVMIALCYSSLYPKMKVENEFS